MMGFDINPRDDEPMDREAYEAWERQTADAELNVCGNAKAPAGWYCSRQAGHDGPCAARRIVGSRFNRRVR